MKEETHKHIQNIKNLDGIRTSIQLYLKSGSQQTYHFIIHTSHNGPIKVYKWCEHRINGHGISR